jgi:cysteinyl-tRNA synthetase
MKLYNSLSKKIEYIDDKIINIYNCGPTVYNDIHIGNSRPVIVFDVLYRYLVSQNIEVNYLHNLTDIDDKIIAAAKNKNQSELQLSSYFSKQYEDIRKKLNIKDMIIEKVSDNIDGIIDYIDRLVKTNGAYVVNGNVYFDTKKNSEYGKLSHRSIDDQNKVERIEENSEKKNPTDFVL